LLGYETLEFWIFRRRHDIRVVGFGRVIRMFVV
jgi:hypothetical protein